MVELEGRVGLAPGLAAGRGTAGYFLKVMTYRFSFLKKN